MKSFVTKAVRAVILAGLLSLFSTATRADIKNFTIQGIITEVRDGRFLLDGSITNGTRFEGFYVFDTQSTDSNSDPMVGDYRYTNSTFGVVVKVGNYVFRTNPRHVNFLIEVVNRLGRDNYLLRSYNNVCSQPLAVDHIAWQLDDSTGTAVTNDSLPLTPPNLSDFQSDFGLTISGLDESFFLRGTVTADHESPATIPYRPAVTVADAIEVSWRTQMGYFYQLQWSENMDTWTDIGEPVLGDGTVLSKFFARQPEKKVFYRAEIANFSK